MRDTLFLAIQYIKFHRAKTFALGAAITLALYFPWTLSLIVQETETALLSRASNTPFLLGAKGSRNDLALHGLYLGSPVEDTIPYSELESINTSGLADGTPLFIRHTASEFPVVGTSLEYLDFRGLKLNQGRRFRRLGEAVVGATVASALGLKVGDGLVSDTSDGFGLTGVYPLKMRIAGVLAPEGTPDDGAVFVDVKTAWVIEGIGHGHQDLQTVEDDGAILERTADRIVANAALREYNEITDETIDRFHFHGAISENPLTAVIVTPHDQKGEALIRGRYLRSEAPVTLIRSLDVVESMFSVVFNIKRYFDRYSVFVALSCGLLIALVVSLSIQLRERELRTMVSIGCAPGRQWGLVAAELALTLSGAIALTGLLVALTLWNRDSILNLIF